MPFCSLCNAEYDDKIKSCSLSHCVSCGSTRIWSENIRSINPISLIVLFSFLAIVFIGIFMDVFSKIAFFIGMFAVILGWTISDSFKSHTINLCLNCFAKGFTLLRHVKLQETKKEEPQKEFSPIDPQKIKEMLNIKTTDNRKLNFGHILIIIGLIIAILGIIFGEQIQKSIDSML